MISIKENYKEFFSYCLLLFSFLYFLNALMNNLNQQNILTETKKQLEQKNLQQSNTSYECTSSSFEELLKNSGFKNIKIQEKSNLLLAITEINEKAQKKLLKFNYINSNINENCIIYKWKKQEDPKILKLDGFFYISENNWVIWINGIKYDQNNRAISKKDYIKEVTKKKISIMINEEEKMLY